MKRPLLMIASALAVLVFCLAARASVPDFIPGRPYVIQFSPGGQIDEFRQEGRALRRAGIEVQVDGRCYSACTILLDEVGPAHVCITPNAELGFHQGTADGWLTQVSLHIPVAYRTPGLRAWITAQGGLPPDGTLLIMRFYDAEQIYQRCA